MRVSERIGTLGMCAMLAIVSVGAAPAGSALSVEALMGADTTAGTSREVSCGAGWVLVGVKGNAGLWINNLFLTCQRVNGGTLGEAKTLNYNYQRIGGLASGTFTRDYSVRCPSGMVVKGVMVYRGSYIHKVGLYCRTWTSAGTTTGNLYGPSGGTSSGTFDARTCIDRMHGVTALRARHGTYIDALGVRCRAP